MKVLLSNESQSLLRRMNLISSEEVAYKFGDLFIAENTISGSRRQLESVPDFVIESSSKPGLLKG